MSRVKQTSKQKRNTKTAAVKVLGAAGLSFSLAGGASASTMPTVGIPQSDNTSPNQRYVLSDEEMADVNLATFYVFDKENVSSGVREARGAVVVPRRRRVRWLPWLWRAPRLRRFRGRRVPRLRLRWLRVRWRLDRRLRGCGDWRGCCGSWGACRLC